MASRLRVRDLDNTFWMDVCYFEIYVRNDEDTGWDRLLPNGDLFIRNGSNSCWLEIGCTDNTVDRCPNYGDPYDPSNPLSPNFPGVILGPDGEIFGPDEPAIPGTEGNNPYNPEDGYNTTTGYPDGYHLGEPGTRDPEVIPDPTSPSGQAIVDYETGQVYTYVNDMEGIPTIPVCDLVTTCEPGTYAEPISCPASVQSAGVNMMQIVHYLFQVSGIGRLFFSVYTGTAHFKIFQGGNLIAQTNGEVFGSGDLQFTFDLNAGQSGDPRIMVQVFSSDPNSEWSYMMPCPNEIFDTYGTPVDPAPCHALVEPTWGQGRGIQENYHFMGHGAGNVVFEYELFSQPDRIDIFYKGQRIAGTSGFETGGGVIQFAYNPDGTNGDLLVRIEGAEQGTSYIYRIYCPDQLGSSINPLPCGTDSVIGQGAGITDTYIALGSSPGQVGVRYEMFNVPDTLEVYQNGTLVASTGGDVSGEGQVGFVYDPNDGQVILVRIIGSTGNGNTTWAMISDCPSANGPEVTVAPAPGNEILPELDGSFQIFNARLTASFPVIVPSTVDYFIVYSGAADSTDVSFQSGTVTLNPGDETVDFPIQVNSDYDAEPDETFSVQIHNPVNVTLGSQDIATFTIENDDFVTNPDITVSATTTTFDEGDTGDNTPVSAVITLSGPSATSISVDWEVSVAGLSNPATIGDDVIGGSGTVTFQAGETTKSIGAVIIGDDDPEGNEEFKIVISNNTGGTITQAEQIFTINDDEIPVIPCNNTTNSGGAGVTETYHDLGASAGTATISYQMFSAPDRMDVYYGNSLIATTGGFVSGTGSFNINWNPGGGSTLIRVVMTGSGSGTAWNYEVFCP